MIDLADLESQVREDGHRLIAGVDETGRGALAGPLLAAAVILPEDFDSKGVRNSKDMKPSQREDVYPRILAEAVAVSVCWVSPSVLDAATDGNAFDRCHEELLQRTIAALNPQPDFVLVDYLELDLAMPHRSIPHGESVSVSIAAASIVAKVTRDRMMTDLGRHLDRWALEANKGYGPEQNKFIELHGVSPVHRLSSQGVKRALQTYESSQPHESEES